MPEDYFDKITLFNRFSSEQKQEIRELFTSVQAPEGSLLFAQGSPAQYLFIVVSGEVLIEFKPDDAPPMEVGRIRPEGVVGWSAALGSDLYTSSAKCLSDCCLLQVRSDVLQDFYHHSPDIAGPFINCLAEVIAQRIRNTHSQVVGLLESGLRLRQAPVYKVD